MKPTCQCGLDGTIQCRICGFIACEAHLRSMTIETVPPTEQKFCVWCRDTYGERAVRKKLQRMSGLALPS